VNIMNMEEDSQVPEFKSLKEEREYWEARGPLAEGHRGKLSGSRPGQRRSSFLAVRLTGEELTRLRDVSARHGLGPSTYARMVLTSAIDREERPAKCITFDRVKVALENDLPQTVREKGAEAYGAVSTGNIPYLLDISKLTPEGLESLGRQCVSLIIEAAGVKTVPSDPGRGAKPGEPKNKKPI